MEDVQSKANKRIVGSDTGLSSKTMRAYFIWVDGFHINHPRDPSDFGRCYRLLEAVPERKYRVWELRKLSKTWENFSDNRDKLTVMYEQNVKEDWKNHKEIGMYDFMKTLIVGN